MNAAEALTVSKSALSKLDQQARIRSSRIADEIVSFVKVRIEAAARQGARSVVARFGSEKVSTNVRAFINESLIRDGFNVVRSSSSDIEVSW